MTDPAVRDAVLAFTLMVPAVFAILALIVGEGDP